MTNYKNNYKQNKLKKKQNKIYFTLFQITPWEALKAELIFALDIRNETKPVHMNCTTDDSESKGSRKSSVSSKHINSSAYSLRSKHSTDYKI